MMPVDPEDARRYRALRAHTRAQEDGIEVWCDGDGHHRPVFLRRLGSTGGAVSDYGAYPLAFAEDAFRYDDRPSHFHLLGVGDHWKFSFTCPACTSGRSKDWQVRGERLAEALGRAQDAGKTRILLHELLS
jgi:hypothetical protein